MAGGGNKLFLAAQCLLSGGQRPPGQPKAQAQQDGGACQPQGGILQRRGQPVTAQKAGVLRQRDQQIIAVRPARQQGRCAAVGGMVGPVDGKRDALAHRSAAQSFRRELPGRRLPQLRFQRGTVLGGGGTGVVQRGAVILQKQQAAAGALLLGQPGVAYGGGLSQAVAQRGKILGKQSFGARRILLLRKLPGDGQRPGQHQRCQGGHYQRQAAAQRAHHGAASSL